MQTTYACLVIEGLERYTWEIVVRQGCHSFHFELNKSLSLISIGYVTGLSLFTSLLLALVTLFKCKAHESLLRGERYLSTALKFSKVDELY